MSRRALSLTVLLPVAVALVGCVVAAAGNDRDLVLRNNGFAAQAVPLKGGTSVCQRRLVPSEHFDGVRFNVSGHGPSADGPRLDVEVRRGGRVLATGVLESGYRGQRRRLVRLNRPVTGDSELSVCFRNPAALRADLFGDTTGARDTDVLVDGKARFLTLQMDLVREPRSGLALIGTVFQRASVLRPGFVGPWLFWLLAGAMVFVLPALLVRAVTAAADDEPAG